MDYNIEEVKELLWTLRQAKDSIQEAEPTKEGFRQMLQAMRSAANGVDKIGGDTRFRKYFEYLYNRSHQSSRIVAGYVDGEKPFLIEDLEREMNHFKKVLDESENQ